jgi:hypothetical protein
VNGVLREFSSMRFFAMIVERCIGMIKFSTGSISAFI